MRFLSFVVDAEIYGHNKEEREKRRRDGGREGMREDWSLSSLPVEGRACEESLGSSQKMKKWKDSQLVPKKGISDTRHSPWLVGTGHC